MPPGVMEPRDPSLRIEGTADAGTPWKTVMSLPPFSTHSPVVGHASPRHPVTKLRPGVSSNSMRARLHFLAALALSSWYTLLLVSLVLGSVGMPPSGPAPKTNH